MWAWFSWHIFVSNSVCFSRWRCHSCPSTSSLKSWEAMWTTPQIPSSTSIHLWSLTPWFPLPQPYLHTLHFSISVQIIQQELHRSSRCSLLLRYHLTIRKKDLRSHFCLLQLILRQTKKCMTMVQLTLTQALYSFLLWRIPDW